MPRMTPALTTVKKAAVGGKKSPAGAGTKTAAWEKPLPGPPQGAGVHSCCVLDGWVEPPPLGEGWGGAYTRGGSPFSLCLRRLDGTPSPWGGLGWGLSTLGSCPHTFCYSVRVAISRRRYTRLDYYPTYRWRLVCVGVTPSANRNSYRVAILFYILTQGSVLRPQPWAGESQLLQSCQGCVLSTIEAPSQPSPRGRSRTQQPQTQQE